MLASLERDLSVLAGLYDLSFDLIGKDYDLPVLVFKEADFNRLLGVVNSKLAVTIVSDNEFKFRHGAGTWTVQKEKA